LQSKNAISEPLKLKCPLEDTPAKIAVAKTHFSQL